MADYSHRDGELVEVEVEFGHLIFNCLYCGKEFTEGHEDPVGVFYTRVSEGRKDSIHKCVENAFGVGMLLGCEVYPEKKKLLRRIGAY